MLNAIEKHFQDVAHQKSVDCLLREVASNKIAEILSEKMDDVVTWSDFFSCIKSLPSDSVIKDDCFKNNVFAIPQIMARLVGLKMYKGFDVSLDDLSPKSLASAEDGFKEVSGQEPDLPRYQSIRSEEAFYLKDILSALGGVTYAVGDHKGQILRDYAQEAFEAGQGASVVGFLENILSLKPYNHLFPEENPSSRARIDEKLVLDGHNL